MIRITKTKFGNTVILLYGILETLKYFRYIPVSVANIILCLIGSISIVYIILKFGANKHGIILLFFLLYEITGFISHLYNNNTDLIELLWPTFFAGIALVLININVDEKIPLYLMILFSIRLAAEVLINGSLYNTNGLSESRNYSVVYVLSFYSMYIILRIRNGKNDVPWLATLILIGDSTISFSRSAILMSAIILAGFILLPRKFAIRNKRKFNHVISFAILVLIISVFLLPKYINLDRLVNSAHGTFLRFNRLGMNSDSRTGAWEEYIKSIQSIPDLLFGPSIMKSGSLQWTQKNLHNSYLSLYARYGLITFLLTIFLILTELRKLCRRSTSILFILFFAVLVRCYTDTIAFNGIMDITIYYFIFHRYTRSNKIELSNSGFIAFNDTERRSIR